MAGREKKPALLKKQVLTPVPHKDADTSSEASATRLSSNKADVESVTQSDAAPTAKAIKKPRTRKPLKKNLKINFKTRARNAKKLKLTKSIFKTNKLTLDTKNVALINNGTKNKKTQKPKPQLDNESKISTAEDDLQPPILEPMIPLSEESHMPKKELKKRLTKKHVPEDPIGSNDTIEKKQKLAETSHAQTVEELLNEVANDLQIDLNALVKKPMRKTVTKKVKTDGPAKSNAKPKKVTPKKLKSDNVRLRRPIKGQRLIDSFCKEITLDSEAQSVINNLDLNVTKTAKKQLNKKRRHSIEKIPALEGNQGETTFEQPFVFSNTRRSASPKSKRNSKIRKSVESTVTKRLNPYATRSDSPARILRNGKHRKLKDSPLLDGLNSEYKKRRRLCSDYSGSEISKCSGYLSESDSSFSDLASVQENGANDIDSPKEEGPILKKGILDSIKIQSTTCSDLSPLENLNIKQISTKFTAILKRSLSTEASQILDPIINEDLKPKLSEDVKMRLSEDVKPKLDEKMRTLITGSPTTKLSDDVKNKLIENMKAKLSEVSVNSFTDTNSNDLKLEIKTELITEDTGAKGHIQVKTEKDKCDESNNIKFEKTCEEDNTFMPESVIINPSEKVPDKALILDSMKLTFNDLNEATEKRSTRSSKRGLRIEEKNLETVSPIKFYGPEITSESETAIIETASEDITETVSSVSENISDTSETVSASLEPSATSKIISTISEIGPPTLETCPPTSGTVPPTSGTRPPTSGAAPPASGTDPLTLGITTLSASGANPTTSGIGSPSSGTCPSIPGTGSPISGTDSHPSRTGPPSGTHPPTSGIALPTSGTAPPTSGIAFPTSETAPRTSECPTPETSPPTLKTAPPTLKTAPPTLETVPPTLETTPSTSGTALSTSGAAPSTSETAHSISRTGPSSSGTGLRTSGTGPSTSGTGPSTSGTSPSTSGTGPSTSGTGFSTSGTGFSTSGTSSSTSRTSSSTSRTGSFTSGIDLPTTESITSSTATPEILSPSINTTTHQSCNNSNEVSEENFSQKNCEIEDVIAENISTETDPEDTEQPPDDQVEEDKEVEEELNVEENDHIGESELKNNVENEIEIDSSRMEVQDISVFSAEMNGGSHESEEKEIGNKKVTQDENDQAVVQMPLLAETPEEQAIKENILSALGLQSLRAAEEAKQRDKQKIQTKPETYTGTLKTVIKLNRQPDKKKRNPLKMTLQKSKSRHLREEGDKSDGANGRSDGENSCYKVMKEGSNSAGWRQGSHSSDSAGANRKSYYSNRSNMDGSSEHASDGDVPAQDGESSGTKALVIPEKASSFSIHPDRLCSDECAYCFGKFGLFDTPLHIAQIKSEERQNKILENEIYLTRDSCLCDACYRHVDRRLNSATAGFNNKNMKRSSVMSNLPRQNDCHVLGCDRESSHVLRRKWLMKMRKSVSKVINIDLDNPGLHSIPICSEHYVAVEHLMICALCKRRLARNHIHYLGFELDTLNTALEKEGIPVKLTDKPVVCKLCRYFATLLLKESGEIKSNTANFFKQYKKRLLHFHHVEVMDEAEAEEPIAVPLKEKAEKELPKKKKNKTSKNCSNKNNSHEATVAAAKEKSDQSRVPSNSENGESLESTPSDGTVDIETLIPNMILECASDSEEINKSEVPHNKTVFKKLQIPESVREAVEISKIMKITRKPNAVDRLGSNPSISVRQLFPGEEDLPLHANIDFNTVKERTAEGWEKCSCTIQYDVDTKHLWQELQKPYGNQSSFLRHLILLEKYFRNGDLTLSPNASHHAVNYSVSVQNRLRAYDNIPTNSLPMQPLTMLPFNQVKKSQSGIITTKDPVGNLTSILNAANLPKNTPISISQLNPNLLTQLSVRQKTPGVPPGLISLQPGTNRPIAPIGKLPQKFKLPIGKNWRPTLIPVTPKTQALCGNPGEKRISGLVQVISGGKPYHISLSDYNKMCVLKKNHDLKQKAVEAKMLKQRDSEMSSSSLLKPVIPRKPKMPTATTTSAAAVSTVVGKAVTVTAITKDVSQLAEMKSISVDKPKEIISALPENKPVKSIMLLPKIPKSLTVIPQTVARKPLQACSPTLSITTKPSTSKS